MAENEAPLEATGEFRQSSRRLFRTEEGDDRRDHDAQFVLAAWAQEWAKRTPTRTGYSIAAHPTLAEGLKEAGLVALGRPIHLPPLKKR